MTSSEGRLGPWLSTAGMVLVALLFHAAPAHASDAVERARLALEEGRLEQALEMLDRAAAGDGLTQAEVRELLLLRASIEAGLQDNAAADLDLRRLARLGVEGELPPFVGPALRRRFEALRQSVDVLNLELAGRPTPGGIEIVFDEDDSSADLVRSFRIWTRVPGASWVAEDGRRVRLLAPMGVTVEYFGEAIGLGGAVVQQVGSREVPRTLVTGPSGGGEHLVGDGNLADDALGEGRGSDVDGGDDAWVWVLVSLAVVAAGAGLGLTLYFTLDGSEPVSTHFGPPQISW